MSIVGLDIGSRFTKIAFFEKQKPVFRLFDSAKFYREFGSVTDNGFLLDFKKLNLREESEIVATGYGRERATLAGATEISEIQAHTLGAIYLLRLNNFTLIDFGGQDTKIIRVESSEVVDFRTSDRCAASTGRYLENMARILGMKVEELSNYRDNPVDISSTCAVFAETELLEKMALGIPRERLASGVNMSIVKRFLSLIKGFKNDVIVASGGVANNKAIIELLGIELQTEITVPPNPQFTGAIGCIEFWDKG